MEKRHHLLQKFRTAKSVTTDTRTISENAIFFALKGDNFNGNLYAEQALEKGASMVVIDEPQDHLPKDKFILVDDVLESLQQLATDYRKLFKGQVIGLTGSNGKTTCKELFREVSSTTYATNATIGNLNNHIGVPLTILATAENTEIIIIEMGANHQNEIAALCEIAQPDIGYITNFGHAHLEGFGGFEGVINGKSELYKYLRQAEKSALIFSGDPIQIEKSTGIKTITFGEAESDRFKIYDLHTDLASVRIENTEIKSQLTGSFHAVNISAAVALGKYLGIENDKIKRAIENYTPKMNRGEWRKTANNDILLDAYNANPDSMEAAIKTFAKLNKQNKWLVLGDMFEMGDYSEAAHQKIVDLLHSLHFKNVVLVGKAFYATDNSAYNSFETTQEAQDFMLQQKLKNATVLLKGSRGMKLESLLVTL